MALTQNMVPSFSLLGITVSEGIWPINYYTSLLMMLQMAAKSYMSDLTRKMQSVIRPISKGELSRVNKKVDAYMSKQEGGFNSRFRIIEIGLSINKPDNPESVPSRIIHALVADYSNNRYIEFIFDSQGNIVRVKDYEGLQPGASDEEIKEASTIARSDKRLADLLTTKALLVTSFGPHSDTKNRVIGLCYSLTKKGIGSQSLARALVDLTKRRVTFFEKIGSTKGEDAN